MRPLLFTLLAATALLGGCTTSLKSSTPSDGISQGFKYRLPRVAYDALVTRVVTHCPRYAGDPIQFDVKAAATVRMTAGEEVLIDYTSLTNGAKTTSFEAHNYPNGVLKSVNMTVNDNTAAIIGEGVKAAVAVGKVAIGLGAGPIVSAPDKPQVAVASLGPDEQPVIYLRCTASVDQTLGSLPDLEAAQKKAQADSKAADKAYADLLEASKAGKPPAAADLAKLKADADDKANALKKAKEALADAQEALTLLQRISLDIQDQWMGEVHTLAQASDGKAKPETMFEIFEPTTNGRFFLIPLKPAVKYTRVSKPNGQFFLIPLTPALAVDYERLKPQKYDGTPAAAQELARDRQAVLDAINTAATDNGQSPYADALAQLSQADVTIVAHPLGEGTPVAALPKAVVCSGEEDCGVVYRSPVPGRLRICGGSVSNAGNPGECIKRMATESAVLFQEERTFPQFGGLAALPLMNKAFGNNTLAASFGEDGQLLDMTYAKPVAETQALLASVNQGLGGVSELITYGKGKELRDLKAKQALYEQQLATDEAQAKLTPSELAKVKDQKALVDAQIALAEAQARQQPSELMAVQNRTLLLQAQQLNVQAQIDLAKKQKELEALGNQPAPGTQ